MVKLRQPQRALVLFLMRAIHGMTVVYCMYLDVKLMRGFYELWLRPRRSPIPDASFNAEMLVLGGSLLIQVGILLASWVKFDSCSFRTAAGLYSAWFLLFLYHPWFARSPIALTFYDPLDPKEVTFQFLCFALWVFGQAIFPALRFLETRGLQQPLTGQLKTN